MIILKNIFNKPKKNTNSKRKIKIENNSIFIYIRMILKLFLTELIREIEKWRREFLLTTFKLLMMYIRNTFINKII